MVRTRSACRAPIAGRWRWKDLRDGAEPRWQSRDRSRSALAQHPRTAEIGATPKGDLCRLALTESDRLVRQWFRDRSKARDCTVTVDDMGNMFARRAGRDPRRAPIAIGSHLDTQPTGGRFDGVIGVLAGLEVLRTLHETDTATDAPIEVINWTNEEGSRFAPAMLSSGVFGGAFSRDRAYARTDRRGERFDAALDGIGYRGDEPCGMPPLSAHLELHIEHGPVLEDEGKVIGIVTGVGARAGSKSAYGVRKVTPEPHRCGCAVTRFSLRHG